MASCVATSSRSCLPTSGSEVSSCASQRSRSSPESARTESNPAESLPHCSAVHRATSLTVGQHAVGCLQMMLQKNSGLVPVALDGSLGSPKQPGDLIE